jgi:hypothetical protein
LPTNFRNYVTKHHASNSPGADAESVVQREEDPPDGDDNNNDSIQAGIPFPNHELSDLNE